jgi:ribonuclease BN (tRNA processing enzyme)
MEPGSVAGVPRHWLARRHLGSVIGMRLTMVGCSGSMPGPHSAASCYLLEADGFRLVVDLGNGAVGALQRYTALNRVDAVALSHLHADHCLDMCPLWIARKYSDEDPLPNLHLCGRQAGQHAARAGAGRLILTHLAPDIDPARSLAAAAGAFGGVVLS